MVKPEWGMRHACKNCGASFYDFNKPKPVCPKCNASPTKTGRKTPAAPKPFKPRAAAPEDAEVEEKKMEGEPGHIDFDPVDKNLNDTLEDR